MNGLLGRLSGNLFASSKTRRSSAADELAAAGLVHHRAGRVREALACYREALAQDPAHFDALHLAGVAHQQCGESEAAIDLMRRAVAVSPHDPAGHGNLAVAYLSLGRLAEAEACVRRALALRPDWDVAYLNLGNVLQAMDRPGDAEEAFRRAIALNANSAPAWAGLGSVLSKSGKPDAALDCYRKAAELDPSNAGTCNSAGTVHQMRGEWPQAVHWFRRAVQIAPGFVEALCNLAGALRRSGNIAEAVEFARRALAIGTDDADALANLASVLIAAGDLAQAEECCGKALKGHPAHVAALVASGTTCKMRGDLAGAKACLRRAIEADPASAAASYNLAMIELAQGEYKQGFAHFESRFAAVEGTPWDSPRQRELLRDPRRWRGEPIAGRRLLVWGEQGYGDVIMMLRYLRLLKDRGAGKLVVCCEPALSRLVAAMGCADEVVAAPEGVPSDGYDLHCPIMSLPSMFATTSRSIPGAVPYLHVTDEESRQWHRRLSTLGRLKVGLAWAGARKLADDSLRSIPVRSLALPVLQSGATAISLQKGEAAGDAREGAITDFIDDCEDFFDTAGLMASLDLVVSVDTAVAHLAGALGVPVWLLNRHQGDWRWGLSGERSAWYPTMRIFRQSTRGDWSDVLARVGSELRREVESRGGQR